MNDDRNDDADWLRWHWHSSRRAATRAVGENPKQRASRTAMVGRPENKSVKSLWSSFIRV